MLNVKHSGYIEYGRHTIEVKIDRSNIIWFSGKQSALALGYKNTVDALKTHVRNNDKISARYMNIVGKKPHAQTIYINEGGLYSLILRSRLKTAEKFQEWVTSDVLPAIRKYGTYTLKKQHEKEKAQLLLKLRYLDTENKAMRNDLKKDLFPKGGLVYVVDFSTPQRKTFRIGKTGNMALRKKIYDTHSLHNKKVVYMKQTNDPIKLETCVRAMLYEYRYRNNKDMYICPLAKIKKAFENCLKSFDNMKGGGGLPIGKEIKNVKAEIVRHDKKINKLKQIINKKD